MIFPRREEASNKDLILTIIEIQSYLQRYGKSHTNWHETLNEIVARLEQEPCELLIIKSDILLHQDDRKKWMESIKREKESGVIILPPYFEPLLVPNDIEISIEQEPKTGHWIEKDGFDGDVYYDCSECGESWTTIEGTPWDNEWKYCPNCGARMVEPQESEE